MRRFLRGSLPFAVAIALVAGGTPASAAKPEVEVHIDEEWFTLPPISCDGFELTEAMVSEEIRLTTFFDRDGNPTAGVMQARFEGVITNSVTGEQFRDHSVFRESFDEIDGTVTVSGPSYHYIRKGEGQVYAEVGHRITLGYEGDLGYEILFQAGQTDYVDSGLQGLCDAFA